MQQQNPPSPPEDKFAPPPWGEVEDVSLYGAGENTAAAIHDLLTNIDTLRRAYRARGGELFHTGLHVERMWVGGFKAWAVGTVERTSEADPPDVATIPDPKMTPISHEPLEGDTPLTPENSGIKMFEDEADLHMDLAPERQGKPHSLRYRPIQGDEPIRLPPAEEHLGYSEQPLAEALAKFDAMVAQFEALSHAASAEALTPEALAAILDRAARITRAQNSLLQQQLSGE